MSRNVLDPLYATCLALTDAAGETVLIYSLDMTAPGAPWSTDMVPAIALATGIPQTHILSSAIHTQDYRAEEATYIRTNFLASGDRATWGAEALRRGYHSVYHACLIAIKSNLPPTLDVHLPTVSIGDVAFAFAPYEMFDTNGMQIKEASPFPMTMILTCANGERHSYVPSALGFQNGGYSVDSCWFLPGSGEEFAQALIAGLKRLHD